MTKCDSPVNLLHIFRTPFIKNTSGWLLLCLGYLLSKNIILRNLFCNKSSLLTELVFCAQTGEA